MIRTYDKSLINSVLKHPDIWPLIADNEDIDSFDPPMGENHYLFEEGALFILHPLENGLQIHANILPNFRFKAMKLAKDALIYGFALTNTILARIPVQNGNVYGFALKFMNDEGVTDGVHHLRLEKLEWAL